MERPTKPCWNCGSNAWWQRPDGGWNCGRCHPNPNPDSNPSQEGHSAEVLALRDRVKLGNDKLFKAWLQIRELAHDSESWNYEMDRISEAAEKLRGLCRELKDRGYRDCLYLENGKKTRGCLQNPDGFWCQVCSSDISYWGKELMDLPRSRVKSSPPRSRAGIPEKAGRRSMNLAEANERSALEDELLDLTGKHELSAEEVERVYQIQEELKAECK